MIETIVCILFLGGGPLLFGAIYLLSKILYISVRSAVEPTKEEATPRETAPAKQEAVPVPDTVKTEPVKATSLSHEQRVQKCSAIIEDAYDYKDEFLDTLMIESSAKFSVPKALDVTVKQYDAQFGERAWKRAWLDSLALTFGIPFTYEGKGVYKTKGGAGDE